MGVRRQSRAGTHGESVQAAESSDHRSMLRPRFRGRSSPMIKKSIILIAILAVVAGRGPDGRGTAGH